MESSTFESVKCYATIQKILKAVSNDNSTVVNEENYSKIAGRLLMETTKQGTVEQFQDDFAQLAQFFAVRYNSSKNPESGEQLESLSKNIYSCVKDTDIKLFFLGGQALNMHARANAEDKSKLVHRISGDIDIKVDEEKLTEFLSIMDKNISLKEVVDRRITPPEERHIANFEKNGTPRSGPLIVLKLENGVNIDVFPIRIVEDKFYDVGYYPSEGVPQAYLKQKSYSIDESGNIEDPPHMDVVTSFVSKCNLGREKDFVDAYNLVAGGIINSESLENNSIMNNEPISTWEKSNLPIDDHSQSASSDIVDYQKENMGFDFKVQQQDSSMSVETTVVQ